MVRTKDAETLDILNTLQETQRSLLTCESSLSDTYQVLLKFWPSLDDLGVEDGFLAASEFGSFGAPGVRARNAVRRRLCMLTGDVRAALRMVSAVARSVSEIDLHLLRDDLARVWNEVHPIGSPCQVAINGMHNRRIRTTLTSCAVWQGSHLSAKTAAADSTVDIFEIFFEKS